MKIQVQSQNVINVLDLTPEAITSTLVELGQSKFRATQIIDWIYNKNVYDFDEMTNLSLKLREELKSKMVLELPKVVNTRESKDGSSKLLLEMEDNNKIEMVLMPNENRVTLCISSQVGCSRKCLFCATAKLGLTRNLTTAEIIGQVLVAKKSLAEGQRISNIVFMGMGEPLDNYDNVVQSLRIMSDPKALKLSPRRLTVSTCGLIPKIVKLSKEDVKVKLAVSLNAVLNSKRDKIMPINKIFPLENLKKTLLDFRHETAYKVTFEYVMIKNFNMEVDDIKALTKFLGDQSCKLNLIAWNEVDDLDYTSPSPEDIEKFREGLSDLSCPIILRESRGNDIDAACGQLAFKTKEKEIELEETEEEESEEK